MNGDTVPGVRLRAVKAHDDSDLFAVASLYEESFPPSERVPWADLVGALRHERPSAFLVIGTTATDVVGMLTVTYIENIEAAFLGYLAVRNDFQGRGIGSALVRRSYSEIQSINVERKKAAPLGVFCELEYLRGRSVNRQRRLAFWARLGMHPLQLRWRYPQLNADSPPAGMYLAFAPLRDDVLPFSRDEAERVVVALYSEIYPWSAAEDTLNQVLLTIRKGPRNIGYRPMRKSHEP